MRFARPTSRFKDAAVTAGDVYQGTFFLSSRAGKELGGEKANRLLQSTNIKVTGKRSLPTNVLHNLVLSN